MIAHEAYSVAVIDHYECAVFVCEVADALQVCDYTVHGEYAVCGDELNTAVFCSLKLCAQIVHVVVLITEALCLAETYTVDDARVVEFVGYNGILG